MGEMKNAYKILVRKPEGKISLGRRRCKRVDWIHPAQDRVQWRVLVNTVLNLRVPLKAENFMSI
jgi:hypothetical protein